MTDKEKFDIVITEHLKDGWQNFALQKCEQLALVDEKLYRYKQAIKTISEWDQYTEDYYGGVSIDYVKMAHDIIEFAKNAINNIEGDKDEQ